MTDDSSFIGKQIGNYHILAELNSGSYGTVYQGKHIIFEDDPIVAIKLLHAHLRSAQERDQFFQEARLLKKLAHRYILRIIDAGIQDGLPYIVTEYASGSSLLDRLRQHPHQPFPIEEALTILKQVGQALHYAHQQNIVHRDLKPGNILFNAKGEALLADFGIAIVLEKTKRIDVIGTPSYMAPEQFHGEISQKSDQYALGCIAYELMTGQKAFTAPDDLAVGFKHLYEYPIAPTYINPDIPAHVEQAIFKAIVKQRSDRHTDVSTFIDALQKTSKQWLKEGETLHKLKRYEEALVAFDQAIRLNPNYAYAYRSKGVALRNLKRYEEALAAYDQAIRLNPNNALAYNGKGATLHGLGRYEEALSACDQAIRLDPNNALAYNGKGTALHGLGRYEEALSAYDQAIRLDPNYARAYYNKGNTLYLLKRYEEALSACDQAIRFDPNNALAYNEKGNALHGLRRYEEALSAYDQTIRLDPHNALAYSNKGYTLERLGKKQEAQQAHSRARQLGYNN